MNNSIKTEVIMITYSTEEHGLDSEFLWSRDHMGIGDHQKQMAFWGVRPKSHVAELGD